MSDYDVLVVGSGIAGLSIAVRLSRVGLRVGVVTKASLSDSTTIWAKVGLLRSWAKEKIRKKRTSPTLFERAQGSVTKKPWPSSLKKDHVVSKS